MIVLRRDMSPTPRHTAPKVPGVWKPWRNRPGEQITAAFLCGGCQRLISMSPETHKIAKDGTVSPSFVCTHAGCSWHVFLRLDGWSGTFK